MGIGLATKGILTRPRVVNFVNYVINPDLDVLMEIPELEISMEVPELEVEIEFD